MLKTEVENSNLSKDIIKVYHHEIGTLYFFKNVVISEINDGEHIDMNTAKNLTDAINVFYDETNSFGYISNRVNSFSLSPLDFTDFKKFLRNIKSYCAVTYTEIDSINTSLERHFCSLPYQDFNNLEAAFKWTVNLIEEQNLQLNNK